jgi:hypothetical protein
MKKYTIMAVLTLIVTSNQLNGAHFMPAVRAFASARMPLARLYSRAGTASEDVSREPMGNEWDVYAQFDWHKMLQHPKSAEIAQKKIRIIDACIRNKKIMVPSTDVNYENAVKANTARFSLFGGFSLGAIFTVIGCSRISRQWWSPDLIDYLCDGLLLSGGAGLFIGTLCGGTLGCLTAVPIALIGDKLDIFIRRKAFVDQLTQAKRFYEAYIESPEKMKLHIRKSLVAPLGIVMREPLPPAVLQDLYEESKREKRIQE